MRFRGQVTEDYKHALLARADALLMPSRKEGWGLAVMEAAQHGVPTVGYTFGLRDSVINGKTGMPTPPFAAPLAPTRGILPLAFRGRRPASSSRNCCKG